LRRRPKAEYYRLGAARPAWEGARRRAEQERWIPRIWDRDPTVWKDDGAHARVIRNALGWLTVARTMRGRAAEITEWADGVRGRGISRVVLCGMGGSSLAPEVFARTFQKADRPEVVVLDSTCPEQIRAVEKGLDLKRTLFVISSKSGSTLETIAQFRYFHHKVAQAAASPADAGELFAAITDPGSPLERLAGEHRFGRIFRNFSDIGGRYSALSYFGLVPAALCGADLARLLDRAIAAADSCGPGVPAAENPALSLGTALGALALQGRDKATIVCSGEIASFGTWLEQLIAESTGKEGRGIVPVEGEPLGLPSVYGPDRFFLYERVRGLGNAATDAALDRLVRAGHPVAAFSLTDRYDLAARMFIWELAVAVAGAVVGIDAFDQPNVQESKDNTSRVLASLGASGSLPEPAPSWSSRGLDFSGPTLGSLLGGARAGRDYVCLQIYAARNDANQATLEALRIRIRDSTRCATTAGFGPRFLHSTGQLHKGGPDEGVFLQFVARDQAQVRIPGASYDFGTFLEAQALGDEEALTGRKRRFLRAAARGPSRTGLQALAVLVEECLGELE
jgi:glucose-6-phosphate isomerase